MSTVDTTKPAQVTPQAAAQSGPPSAATPPLAPETRRGTSLVAIVVPPLLVFIAVMGLWILASKVLIPEDNRFLLPAPWDVVNIAFLDEKNRPELFSALWVTTKAALVGFPLAIIIGVSTATLMSQAKWIERALYPYAVILQTLPILALVPVVGFTLGYDFSSRVLVVVVISLFPLITNTLFGLLSADQAQHDLLTLHHASRMTRLLKLQFPAAMPAIFTGLRTAGGLAVVGAVVGDFFFLQGESGIGAKISLYVSQLEGERLYAAVILASALGIVTFLLIGFLERRVVGRWHTSTRHGG